MYKYGHICVPHNIWRSEDSLRLGSLFHLIWDKVSCSPSCIPDKLTLIACWPYSPVLLCPALCWFQGSELRSSIYTAYALCIRPSSQFCFIFLRLGLLAVKHRQTSAMHYFCLNHCSAEIAGITTTLSLLTSHSEKIQSGSVSKVLAISAWWQATWVQISQ